MTAFAKKSFNHGASLPNRFKSEKSIQRGGKRMLVVGHFGLDAGQSLKYG